MPKLIVANREDIAVLRLNNGAANAIDLEMVDELSAALRTATQEARGVVLAGGDKLFSMGFHLPSLIQLDRAAFGHFYQAFNLLTLDLFSLPLPTCCAVGSHAVAGGCILAIACDWRIAANGKKLGLNEIKLGVPVPFLTDLILQEIVGSRASLHMAYSGDFLTSEQAFDIGLVDETAAGEAVEERAVEKVMEMADRPGPAFAAIKACRVDPLRQVYLHEQEARNQAFVDCWFSTAAREKLQEAALKF